MSRMSNQFISFFKSHGKLSLVVIGVALLLEVISAVQYLYTRNIMRDELEDLMGKEITMKAMLVKGMLNYTEGVLNSHADAICDDLVQPDSIYAHLQWLTHVNKHFSGVGLAFVPGYYKDRDYLYEPWTYRDENMPDTVLYGQLGSAEHDYTKLDFYYQTVSKDAPYWAEPYLNYRGAKGLVTTYAIPIHDSKGKVACVAGVDLSLSWLSDTLNQRHSHESSFSLLLTENGELISQPSSSHPKYADFDNAITLINDSTVSRHKTKSGHFTCIEFKSEIDGSTAYVYYAFMKGRPHWQLAIVCYDKEVFDALYSMRHRVFLLMLLGVALLGYIVYRFLKGNIQLADIEMERQRIDSELHVAKRIQSEMLPGEEMTQGGVTLSGRLIPAREVGGDQYDYFVRDDKLFFAIGDASGKGVPSALVMSVSHSLFRAIGARESHPARIMHLINEAVCQGNESNMFVTFFIGVLDLPTGKLRYCNAGHDTPLLVKGEVEKFPVKSNLPLGVMNDWFFEGEETTLELGTTLLLYTDGLTEAMDAQHRQFGLERVCEVSKNHADAEPSRLLSDLIASVRAFVKGAEQSDDLTLLAVRYSPQEVHFELQETLTVQNDVKQVTLVNEFVKNVAQRTGYSPEQVSSIQLAIEEAVVNVMNYAYPEGETGEVEIQAAASADLLRFKVIDSGMPFAPTDAPDVDTSLSAEERQIGGLGIFLVRQMMDVINYERIDGKNVLTLTKKRNC